MNDTLKTINSRFSCRGYDGRPLEREKIETLAMAALAAPSAMNLQPWRIIAITDKTLIDEMDAAAMANLAAAEDQTFYNRMMERGGKIFYNAPCLFLVLKDSASKWGDMDSGIAIQNLALAATSMGLDNVIVAMAAMPFNSPQGDYFKKRIGWPAGFDFGMGICIGYGNTTKEPHEIDLSKVSYI